ncbi:hypothetical protein G6F60_015790 [Rhizopus arrhizus]|nr:hypothetical protein G6F60_015790 [Rhizopus arrhizus]
MGAPAIRYTGAFYRQRRRRDGYAWRLTRCPSGGRHDRFRPDPRRSPARRRAGPPAGRPWGKGGAHP